MKKKKFKSRRQLREAIQKALRFGDAYSDHVIAERVGTSHVTVGKVRREFPQYYRATTIGRDHIRRTRPAKGNLHEAELAAKRFEAAIKMLGGRLRDSSDDREKEQIKTRLLKWIGSINTLAEPLIE